MGKINISGMLKAITRGRASIAPENALMVAISGIDAAGKTTVWLLVRLRPRDR